MFKMHNVHWAIGRRSTYAVGPMLHRLTTINNIHLGWTMVKGVRWRSIQAIPRGYSLLPLS